MLNTLIGDWSKRMFINNVRMKIICHFVCRASVCQRKDKDAVAIVENKSITMQQIDAVFSASFNIEPIKRHIEITLKQ